GYHGRARRDGSGWADGSAGQGRGRWRRSTLPCRAWAGRRRRRVGTRAVALLAHGMPAASPIAGRGAILRGSGGGGGEAREPGRRTKGGVRTDTAPASAPASMAPNGATALLEVLRGWGV